MEGLQPHLSLIWTDSDSGKRGYLVVDRIVEGMATGGTRLCPGVTLDDVTALARSMSLKNALLRLPVGGCKIALDCSPNDEDAEAILTRFMSAVRPFLETAVVTGPDLGTSRELMTRVCAAIGMISPAQAALDRERDPEAALLRLLKAESETLHDRCLADMVAGYGVAEAAEAGMRALQLDIEGAGVAIQGFGSVGGAAALCLARRGARIVAVADVEGTIREPRGLDVAALTCATATGAIDRTALDPCLELLPRDAWLAVDADVLVPAATPGAITEANCEQLRSRLIVEAANLATTPGAERRLHDRGVVVLPDVVVNLGADAFYWWLLLDLVEPTAAAVQARLGETVRRLVSTVVADSRNWGRTPREAAIRLAAWNRRPLVTAPDARPRP